MDVIPNRHDQNCKDRTGDCVQMIRVAVGIKVSNIKNGLDVVNQFNVVRLIKQPYRREQWILGIRGFRHCDGGHATAGMYIA